MSIKITQRAVMVIPCIGSVYLFIYLFQHQRQRAQVTYMPVKSNTMNIYMLDNEQDSSLLWMKWQCLWSYDHMALYKSVYSIIIIIIILVLFFDPGYSIPRQWKKYAMQYKKVQKSSWNEPYSLLLLFSDSVKLQRCILGHLADLGRLDRQTTSWEGSGRRWRLSRSRRRRRRSRRPTWWSPGRRCSRRRAPASWRSSRRTASRCRNRSRARIPATARRIWPLSPATTRQSFGNKKLSHRRGNARCVVSVETLPIAAQQRRNYRSNFVEIFGNGKL